MDWKNIVRLISTRKKTSVYSMKWRLLTIGIVFIMIAVAFNGMVTNVRAEGYGYYPAPQSGDWIITNETFVANETIILKGNLTITGTGKLILKHSTLKFDGGSNGSYKLQINESGDFECYNSTIKSNTTYSFKFLCYGNLTLQYSKIENLWGNNQPASGIQIFSGNVILHNNIVSNQNGSAIYVSDSAPIISNNTIFGSQWGIYIDGWNNTHTFKDYLNQTYWKDDFIDQSKIESMNNITLESGIAILDYSRNIITTTADFDAGQKNDIETNTDYSDVASGEIQVKLGNAFSDNFEDDDGTDIASYNDWTTYNLGTATTLIKNDYKYSGSTSARLYVQSTPGNPAQSKIKRIFGNFTGEKIVGYFMLNDNTENTYIRFQNNSFSNTVLGLGTSWNPTYQNNFHYKTDGVWVNTSFPTYTNYWYKYEVQINWTSRTYKIFITGTGYDDYDITWGGVNLSNAYDNHIDRVHIEHYNNMIQQVYYWTDDLKVGGYNSSSNWTSANLSMSGVRYPRQLKITHSGLSMAAKIINVSLIINNETKASYEQDITSGSYSIIEEGDLTFGSFFDVNDSYQIKVDIETDTNSTPVITEIQSNYNHTNYGNLTTETIKPSSMKNWDKIFVTSNNTGDNSILNITVLNSEDDEPIQGFINLSGAEIDISEIDPTLYPGIKLLIEMRSDGNQSPNLDSVQITWKRWNMGNTWMDSFENTNYIYNNENVIIDNGSVYLDMNHYFFEYENITTTNDFNYINEEDKNNIETNLDYADLPQGEFQVELGRIFNEGFEYIPDSEINNYNSWTATVDEGVSEALIKGDAYYSGRYSARLFVSGTEFSVDMRRTFDVFTNESIIGYFNISGIADTFIRFSNEDEEDEARIVAGLGMQYYEGEGDGDFNFCYFTGAPWDDSGYSVENNTWYKFELEIDWDNFTYKIYITGGSYNNTDITQGGIMFANGESQIDRMRIEFNNGENVYLWLDDIKVDGYFTDSNWTSNSIIVFDNHNLKSTKIVHSNLTSSAKITKIEWIENDVAVVTYENDIISGSETIIYEENLTSGSFNQIENEFQIYIELSLSANTEVSPRITHIENQFVLSGYVTSTTILPTQLSMWNKLDLIKSEEYDTEIKISVIDPILNTPISGFENLSGSQIDLSTINVNSYPAIKLKAYLYNSGSKTPILYEWRVSWIPDSIIIGNIISNCIIGIYGNDSTASIFDNFIYSSTTGIYSTQSSMKIRYNLIYSNDYGINLTNSADLISNNTILSNDIGIKIDNCQGLEFNLNSTSSNNTLADVYFEKDGYNSTVTLLLHRGSSITDASFDLTGIRYIPESNFTTWYSYYGAILNETNDLQLNTSINQTIPANWNRLFSWITEENLSKNGVAINGSSINLSAEHNGYNELFNTSSDPHYALFNESQTSKSQNPLIYNLSTNTSNVQGNFTLITYLNRNFTLNWTSTSTGYNISIPLNASSFVLNSSLVVIIPPAIGFAEYNCTVNETGQNLTTNLSITDDNYLLVELEDIPEIGELWEPTDTNLTLEIELVYYTKNPTLNIGNVSGTDWNYYGGFDSTVTIDQFNYDIDRILNTIIPDNDFGMIEIPLTLYSDSAGRIEISNISINYTVNPLIENNLIDSNTIGTIINNSRNLTLYNNVYTGNDIGIYLNHTTDFESTLTELINGSSQTTITFSGDSNADAIIELPNGVYVTSAQMQLNGSEYIWYSNLTQNYQFKGIISTTVNETAVNLSMNLSRLDGWNISKCIITVENLTLDNNSIDIVDVNLSAEHDNLTLQFYNYNKYVEFSSDQLSASQDPIVFNITANRSTTRGNFTLEMYLTKSGTHNWSEIEDGFNISIPLNASDQNISSPEIEIYTPTPGFVLPFTSVLETSQNISFSYIDISSKDSSYFTLDLSGVTEIGSVWNTTDTNVTLYVNLSCFLHSPTLDIGNDGDTDWEYKDEFNTTVIISESSDSIATEINSLISQTYSGYSYIPLKLSTIGSGNITISNITITYISSTKIYSNNLTGNDIGIYINDSKPFINYNLISGNNEYGIYIVNNSDAFIYDNTIINNTYGLYSDQSTPRINSNNFTLNDYGILSNTSTLIISNNSFYDNSLGLKITNDSAFNVFLNTFTLNDIGLSLVNIASNKIFNSTFKYNNETIISDNATFDMNNCSLSSNDTEIFNLTSDSHGYIYDSEFNVSKVITLDTSNITSYRNLIVSVRDRDDSAMSNATVNITNSENNIFFSKGPTDANGNIQMVSLKIYFQNNSVSLNISEFNINSSHSENGYNSINITINNFLGRKEQHTYIGPDYDNDGLNDGEEIFVYFTSFETNDTDNDDLVDGLELGLTTPHGNSTNLANFTADTNSSSTTSPLASDTDLDGLNDGIEDVDLDGEVDSGETDPNDGDSDNDLLIDGYEHNWNNDTDSDGTINALDIDSDNDGLYDGTEDANLDGITGEGEPNPLDNDTDDDGILDGNMTQLIELKIINISCTGNFSVDVHDNRYPDNVSLYYNFSSDINQTISVGYILRNITVTIKDTGNITIGRFFVIATGNGSIFSLMYNNISINFTSHKFNYNANQSNDTDSDGINDFRESIFWTSLVANFTSEDKDEDSLTNVQDDDSDGDDLTDGEEISVIDAFTVDSVDDDLNIYGSNFYNGLSYTGNTNEYNVFFTNITTNGSSYMEVYRNGHKFRHELTNLTSGDNVLRSLNNSTAEITGFKIEYRDVWNNTNLTHYIYETRIKETLTVYSKPSGANDGLSFYSKVYYNTTELNVVVNGSQESGTFETTSRLNFVNSTGVRVQYFEPPNATDANGNKTNCTYYVQIKSGYMIIAINLTADFVDNAAFPIIVDPDSDNEFTIFITSTDDFDEGTKVNVETNSDYGAIPLGELWLKASTYLYDGFEDADGTDLETYSSFWSYTPPNVDSMMEIDTFEPEVGSSSLLSSVKCVGCGGEYIAATGNFEFTSERVTVYVKPKFYTNVQFYGDTSIADSNMISEIYFYKGTYPDKITYASNNVEFISIYQDIDVEGTTWYRLDFEHDFTTGRYSVWLGGGLIVDDKLMYKSGFSSIKTISLGSGNAWSGTRNSWFDGVEVTPGQTGSWTSGVQDLPDDSIVQQTTFNFNNLDPTAKITKLSWLVNGAEQAAYDTDISINGVITITDDDLTSGSFDDVDGDFQVKVEMERAAGDSPPIVESIEIDCITTSEKPIADAGDDTPVAVNQLVTLDGTGSSDPEDRPLTYQWSHYSGRYATLSDSTSATPTFTPTYAGKAIYKFKLIVKNDANMESEPDYVIITTGIPVAYAGEDQEVKVGDYVLIDARNSIPYPGGPAITDYSWKIPYAPEEFEYNLPDHFNPYLSWLGFYVRHVGEYYFVLWVRDADGTESPPTIVKITVTSTRGNPYSMDTDNDGISDGTETTIGTLISNPDSDGDYLFDGLEMGYTESDVTPDTDLNIFKADADGGKTTTNPLDIDTDGDEIHDRIEDYNGDGALEKAGQDGIYDTFDDETDPNDVDTDNDLLWDGYDVDANNDGIIDPKIDNLGEQDKHIVGGHKIYIGNYLIAMTEEYEFAPTKKLRSDTDGDGLLDGVEVYGWIYNYNYWKIFGDELVELRRYYSDPIIKDSDLDTGGSKRGDGIPDMIEYEKGTNPMKVDTDNDGLKDGFELLLYANPNMADYQKYVKVWNKLPNEHEPNPLKKDIYVEVDWMEGYIGDKAPEDIGLLKAFECKHKMDTDAKKKVINTFKNAPLYNSDGSKGILIHIDDGSGFWSGGNKIPHEKIFPESSWKAIENENGYYSEYFDSTRQGIFHYGIQAHYGWKHTVFYTHLGRGENFGDSFIVFDEEVNDDSDRAHAFLHELGHNLLGSECNDNKCAMTHERDMPTNYCNKCWDKLNLKTCLE